MGLENIADMRNLSDSDMNTEWYEMGPEDLEDEYPQDTAEYEPSDLEYRDVATERVLEAMDAYLDFGTKADLHRLIDNL